MEQDGKRFPLDYKTSIKDFDITPKPQFKKYCWAGDFEKVMVSKVVFSDKKATKEKFQRKTIPYSPHQLEQWRRDTVYWALNYYNSMKSGYFPRKESNCFKYGVCDYYSLCTAGSDAEYRFHMGREFQPQSREPWSPEKHKRESDEVVSLVERALSDLRSKLLEGDDA